MYQEIPKKRKGFAANKYLLLFLVITITCSCQLQTRKYMEDTKANKEFILEMIGGKKKLEDYPGKASDSMVVYEPSSLPFGGVYKGINAYEKFYPEVRKFYDFSRFELINVYAEADVVFAIIKAGIAHTNDSILLCQQFTFKRLRIVEVRLYIHDFPGKSIHSLISK